MLSPPQQGRVELARAALLGINAWLVALLIPALHVGLWALGDLALFVLPLSVLAPGLALLSTRRLGWSRWILLAGYPASLAAVIAARPALVQLDAYGTIGMALASASVLAFMAGAAHALARDRAYQDAQSQPLVGKEPVVEPKARRWMRRALLGASTIGAFVLAVIVPALPSQRERTAVWGEAADDAGVLTSVVASVVTAVALGTLIGPGLRAARPARDEAGRSRRRLAAAMLIGTAAGVGWMVLRQLEAR